MPLWPEWIGAIILRWFFLDGLMVHIECKAELVAKGQALSTIAPHRNRNIPLAIVEVNLRCIWLVGAFELDIGILSTVIIAGL